MMYLEQPERVVVVRGKQYREWHSGIGWKKAHGGQNQKYD